MSCEDDVLITGSVTLDPPVPLSAIEAEYSRLLNSLLATPTYAGDGTTPALTGVAFADEDAWHDAGVWFGVLYTLEAIARRHSSTLASAAAFASDSRGRGHLLVDAGGHFHLVAEGDEGDNHRTRACEVAEATGNDEVRLTEAGAGPFTDFVVHCDEHGEVACPPSRKEALFRREQHLLEKHTLHPLPLGPVAARDVLGQEVLDHVAQAARSLSDARYFARQEGRGGGAVSRHAAARAAARRALAALPEIDPERLTELLVHLLVEQRADR